MRYQGSSQVSSIQLELSSSARLNQIARWHWTNAGSQVKLCTLVVFNPLVVGLESVWTSMSFLLLSLVKDKRERAKGDILLFEPLRRPRHRSVARQAAIGVVGRRGSGEWERTWGSGKAVCVREKEEQEAEGTADTDGRRFDPSLTQSGRRSHRVAVPKEEKLTGTFCRNGPEGT
jgi:hypothetical protein